MDENDDLDELERQIERARRLASHIGDQTTSQRLWGFIEELKQKLQRRALPQGGLSNRSERGPTNFGSNVAGLRAEMWSSGWRRKKK